MKPMVEENGQFSDSEILLLETERLDDLGINMWDYGVRRYHLTYPEHL